jgi:hypothetical protein
LAPGTSPKYSDAERARRKLAMREKRAAIKKDASGFSFAAICEAVGGHFHSPQSSLNPILWERVESDYDALLAAAHSEVPNEQLYLANDRLFVKRPRLSTDSGQGWDTDPELRRSRRRREDDRLLRRSSKSYYDRLFRIAA